MIYGLFDYLIDHRRLFQDLSQCAQISINQDVIKGYYYFTFDCNTWSQFLHTWHCPTFLFCTECHHSSHHFCRHEKSVHNFGIFQFTIFTEREKKRLIELRSSQYDDGFRLVFLEGFFYGNLHQFEYDNFFTSLARDICLPFVCVYLVEKSF